MLPSGRGRDTTQSKSLPVPLNCDNHVVPGRVANSASETRLMNEHPSSTMRLHNEEAIPLQQSQSSIHSSPIQLHEEFDGEYAQGILRRNSSSRLHSSLSGNPVCHPEQEAFATIAPTLVMAATEPHVSLDPDKPCCAAALDEHSSMTSANSGLSFSETLRKNSR